MELDIDLDGPQSATETAALLRWLQSERLQGVEELQRRQEPPKPGEQGPTLLAILTVVLAGPAVVKLVESIHRWIEATRPAAKVKIKTKDGREVTLEVKNFKSLADVRAQAEKLTK